MGFFSSKSKDPSTPTHKLRLKASSLTSPPNIYTSPSPSTSSTSAPPRPPPRPATAQPVPPAQQATLYHHPAASQPQLCSPPKYLSPHHPPGPVPYPTYNHPASPPRQNGFSLGRFSESMVDLAQDLIPTNTAALRKQLTSSTDAASAAYDEIRTRFDHVMTLIDRESLSGHEKSLFLCQEPAPQSVVPYEQPPRASHPPSTDRAFRLGKNRASGDGKKKTVKKKQSQTCHVSAVVSRNYFSKVELYANSKLPSNLPPLRLHSPTWPLLCLAAQFSQGVYTAPQHDDDFNAHIPPSLRHNTKAMRIKAVSMDDAHTIVFAIRGTASFSDWAVNLNMAPASPARFLDDPGNLCHAGFLSVARRMVRPVAARLRRLLEQDPGRAGHSLLMTGHSAGGAVAALLYCHMLSRDTNSESELTLLAGCFRRIHCVTFGAPPVSLLPLETPPRREAPRKSLFLSFVNEGDPVARASKSYVRSLVDLLTKPPPPPPPVSLPSKSGARKHGGRPEWKVPASTLSNAGRIVVLRSGNPHAPVTDYKTVRERLDEGVVAVTCRDDQLRGVIWGDPVAHMMSLYAARIEVLAVRAVARRK